MRDERTAFMDEFVISLAEVPIGIRPLSPGIRVFFSDYMSGETPLFTVSPNGKDLERERLSFLRRNGEDSSLPPLSGQSLERMAILRLIANRMPEYDALLFHGSAVAVNGKAYLFAASSGTGKTTHTNLWLRALPQAYILNGDKPFLRLTADGRFLACGSPWGGKERLGRNEILPLGAICMLKRDAENHIRAMAPAEAGSALLRQVYLPDGTAGVRTVSLMNRLSRQVPLFCLGCNMNPEAAQVSIRAMLGQDFPRRGFE